MRGRADIVASWTMHMVHPSTRITRDKHVSFIVEVHLPKTTQLSPSRHVSNDLLFRRILNRFKRCSAVYSTYYRLAFFLLLVGFFSCNPPPSSAFLLRAPATLFTLTTVAPPLSRPRICLSASVQSTESLLIANLKKNRLRQKEALTPQ